MQLLNNKKFKGLELCTRYAFMPNKLSYCGGDKNSELFEYGVRGKSDPFLASILGEFETLYPYLRLIADNNKIRDLFDYRVVEAYWIGNPLLNNSNVSKFYWHLIDNLKIKKKVKPETFESIAGKLPKGMLPHHNFHVLNVWIRTGHLAITHTLNTMNKCRIGWGKVTKVNSSSLEVMSPALIYVDDILKLSEPQRITVNHKFSDRGFVEPKVNDLVSLHWDFVCDIITKEQMINLHKYTLEAIVLANLDKK
jgi:hypothetical protein